MRVETTFLWMSDLLQTGHRFRSSHNLLTTFTLSRFICFVNVILFIFSSFVAPKMWYIGMLCILLLSTAIGL